MIAIYDCIVVVVVVVITITTTTTDYSLMNQVKLDSCISVCDKQLHHVTLKPVNSLMTLYPLCSIYAWFRFPLPYLTNHCEKLNRVILLAQSQNNHKQYYRA